ncbi:hypothetical protein O181_014461 [Austropuccinia psidii MF-1]|uniref:CCHC-type domain-containing protein n=1 Tax=Austropuccinia psidii MF-1 TaxID=1389203 RepID=A0A9Q3GP60_9BASI|nr:hypothetical protein [Austropuccinia psidii MF-1]
MVEESNNEKYINGTWIWQKSMSFKNERYSVDKDPYEWWELENAAKCRNNQNFTLDDIANTLQDVRKRANIREYSLYKVSSFREKQLPRVDNKDKPRERLEEVTKKKNSCNNCGSTDHYANNCPKTKNKVYAIKKVPEEETQKEYYKSDSMGDYIRENFYDYQDSKEEFQVEYQEETQLKIQEIQLEAGLPQDTTNVNLCKNTQDEQTFLVTPTKGMEFIHGTATNMTICVDNSQNPLIIDSGAHCSILAREYQEKHFPNWKKKIWKTKAKNFYSTSGTMTLVGTIFKEIIIAQRKANIRLNPECLVLEDAHVQGSLLGKNYQRMYGIEI